MIYLNMQLISTPFFPKIFQKMKGGLWAAGFILEVGVKSANSISSTKFKNIDFIYFPNFKFHLRSNFFYRKLKGGLICCRGLYAADWGTTKNSHLVRFGCGKNQRIHMDFNVVKCDQMTVFWCNFNKKCLKNNENR